MNSLLLPLPTGDSTDAESANAGSEWQHEESAPALSDTAPVALMTRRIKPGTSIRRLRNHRSAWPRKA
jgi:hypothetical protein